MVCCSKKILELKNNSFYFCPYKSGPESMVMSRTPVYYYHCYSFGCLKAIDCLLAVLLVSGFRVQNFCEVNNEKEKYLKW